MAIGGTSLHIVGKALGHTDPSATLVYARLTTSPVKEAMGKAAGALLAAANGKQPEVIDATASDAKEASDAQT